MTAMSNPKPTTFRKWRPSTAPTSTVRTCPPATTRAAPARPWSGRLELDQGLEGLEAVLHPLLAERRVVHVGDGEHLVEGVLVQAQAALLLLVLAVLAFHGELREVAAVPVLHERLVEV